MISDEPPRLESQEEERIENAREWVKGHFTDRADEKYAVLDDKLRLLQAILVNEWVDPSETWKLQAMGIALGDAIAQKLMLEWVTVEDEHGRDPALSWPGTSILCYPQTMISKRIERGEAIDVRRLFDSTCAELSDMAFSGRSA